jgi:fructuronate reductase
MLKDTSGRLSNSMLFGLPADVQRPAYDRASLATGILHLGIGAFHRAHMAAYTDAVAALGDMRWGIRAASLRSPETRDALQPQDGLYTFGIQSGEGTTLRVIGILKDVLVAPESPETLIAAMADPAVRIVSLTVTEKGYCHDPATGELNEDHPDIRHDLRAMDRPRSVPAFLVAALLRRHQDGVPPFTILCCDNLPANGRTVRRVILRLAALVDDELARHLEATLATPCTMVDRIVPATTDRDRADVAERLGVKDAWPVMAEPFSQWVIEDHFPLGRPAWEKVGVQFAADVAPFEHMKLRMLNGAHSALAYLGSLAGHVHVSDAASDPLFQRYLTGFWREIIPAVPPPPGQDLNAYADALLARFQNTAIRHKLTQIAMDGSQKVPQRWLGTLRELKVQGCPHKHLVAAIAGFVAYYGRKGASAFPVSDPLADRVKAALAGLEHAPLDALHRLIAIEPIFGKDLAADNGFKGSLVAAHAVLAKGGVAALLRAVDPSGSDQRI